jgi:hypothetical protein
MPYSYSDLLADLERLSQARPERMIQRSYGTSAEGRDLEVLTFGERPEAPRLAFTATPQPGEAAAWCVMAIAEFLAGDDPAARAILDRFVVDLMPMTNPDGIVAGRAKVNAQGVQPLFEFDKASRGESDCPEAAHVWTWLTEHRPEALAEFHTGFVRIADRPSQPYLVNRSLYASEARRRLARRMDLALVGLTPDGNFRNIEAGDKVWQTMMCYQLVARCDTLAYLYQVCQMTLDQAQRHAVRVLQTMADVLSAEV